MLAECRSPKSKRADRHRRGEPITVRWPSGPRQLPAKQHNRGFESHPHFQHADVVLMGTRLFGKQPLHACLNKNNMYDIVFCSLPYSNLDHIYSAPAILKGVVTSNGYSAKTVDFGLHLFDLCSRDKTLFDQAQTYFLGPCQDQVINSLISKFYEQCLNWIKDNPSTFIGLSVLSIYTHKSTFQFAHKLRDRFPERQIVIGGRGLKLPIFSPVHDDIKPVTREKLLSFGDFIKSRKLVDHVIIGDGEDAILKVLADQPVEHLPQDSDRFRFPTPDYDDYKFDDYLLTEKVLPIVGSKGCVRNCDFCDIQFQFGKYRYRSGKDIAKEIISLNQRFKVHKFQFTDSLVNGGLKPFREFIEILSQYNQENPTNKIIWNGQYICRPSDQVPQDLYPIMAQSGAHGLVIGAESGSNKVLDKMNKKTTVEALYDELENFRANNITCVILTFVGHWSETWEDFIDHCKMFVKITPYVRSGTISAVTVGHPMGMLDGTPSMFNSDHNGTIMSDFNKELIWCNSNNPTSTFKERLRRHLLIHKICAKLKIPTINETENFLFLAHTVNMFHDKINKFYDDAI